MRDATITFTSDIPADMIDELAYFLKTLRASDEAEEEEMFVEDNDDVVNVTIARVIRHSTIQAAYSPMEKYDGCVVLRTLGSGPSYAGYVILGSEMTDRAYQEFIHNSARHMTTQLCCLRSWWNQIQLDSLIE